MPEGDSFPWNGVRTIPHHYSQHIAYLTVNQISILVEHMKATNILLAISIVAVFVASAYVIFAEDVDAEPVSGEAGSNATWTLEGDTLTIEGTGWIDGANLPKSGYKHVVIEEGITEINDRTFYDCPAESIEFPDSLTTIGNLWDVFQRAQFRELVIPDGVTKLTSIHDMPNLEALTLGKGITSLGSISADGDSINEGCISYIDNCPSLSEINCPYITNVGGSWVVKNCPSLKYIDLSNVTSIYGSFNDGSSVVYRPFENTGLEFIDLSSVTRIPNSAFSDMKTLKHVELSENLEFIGQSAFSSSGLTSVSIPDGATLGMGTFYNCEDLITIELGNVGTIPDLCFDECYNLKNVTLAEGITTIGAQAFHACWWLESISIPKSVTSIGYVAFSGCASLKEIYIYGNPDIADDGNEAFSLSMGDTYTTVYTDNPGILDGKGNNCNHWTYVDVTADPDREYSIVFMNGDSVFAEYSLRIGETVIAPSGTPTKPSDSRGSYIFENWGGFREGMAVTGNMRFEAAYTLIPIESAEDDVHDDSRFDMGEDGFTVTPDIKDEQDQMMEDGMTSGVIFINDRMSVMFDSQAWAKIPEGGAAITLRQASSSDAPFSADGAVAWFEVAVGDIHDFSPGNVIITLPIPAVNDGMEYTIVTIGIDGQNETLEGNITGDLISFGTDHLSYFAIVESEEASPTPPSSGGGVPMILIIGGVVLILIIIVAAVAVMKRRKTKAD